MKLAFFLEILGKHIKSHENPFSGSRVVSGGQANRKPWWS